MRCNGRQRNRDGRGQQGAGSHISPTGAADFSSVPRT
jgi:hypothetical protein